MASCSILCSALAKSEVARGDLEGVQATQTGGRCQVGALSLHSRGFGAEQQWASQAYIALRFCRRSLLANTDSYSFPFTLVAKLSL